MNIQLTTSEIPSPLRKMQDRRFQNGRNSNKGMGMKIKSNRGGCGRHNQKGLWACTKNRDSFTSQCKSST